VSIILGFFKHSVSEIGSRLVIKHLLEFAQAGIQLTVQKQQCIIIIIIIIIIFIIFITFIQGIYSYIPETNHISREMYYVTTVFFCFFFSKYGKRDFVAHDKRFAILD
jgi:hypothetical protein